MSSQASIRTLVERVLITDHPKTVAQLARKVMAEMAVDETEFIETVKGMTREKAIVLEQPSYEIETIFDYLFSITVSGWFWVTLAVTSLSLIVITMSPDAYPLDLPKWVLGSLFVLFLPGYTVLQLLFPKGSDLDSLERFALDIGVSLAAVAIIGLVLNFTPWGIRLDSIMTSLTSLIVMVSIGAALREYWAVRT